MNELNTKKDVSQSTLYMYIHTFGVLIFLGGNKFSGQEPALAVQVRERRTSSGMNSFWREVGRGFERSTIFFFSLSSGSPEKVMGEKSLLWFLGVNWRFPGCLINPIYMFLAEGTNTASGCQEYLKHWTLSGEEKETHIACPPYTSIRHRFKNSCTKMNFHYSKLKVEK